MQSGGYDQKSSVYSATITGQHTAVQIDYVAVEVKDETMISAQILTVDYSSICSRFS